MTLRARIRFGEFIGVSGWLAALICASPAASQNDASFQTAQVVKRGAVACGVSRGEGFAESVEGAWRGFDIDLCHALAAAIFDDPNKIQIMELAPRERVTALQLGWVDVLVSGPAWTLSRDAGLQVYYAGVSLHDGQGFMARRQRSFGSVKDLGGVSICVQQGTPHELDLVDYFGGREMKYEPKLFMTFEDAAAAYDGGQCDVLTADVSTLHVARLKLAAPADHTVLPDMISKSPHGPVVRQDDAQWFKIVRWTLNALLDAEELGVSNANVDTALKSENPNIRRLLGVEGDRGAGLGLPANWAYRIIKHVGNYADIFERNLGNGSPYAMERRQNALWTKGGLMYAPPVR